MGAAVEALFERYAAFFNRAIDGSADMGEIAAFYAPEFIAASPRGVMTGKNDERLPAVMQQGYAHYRAIGSKEMRLHAVRITSIDDLHCLASVSWTAVYDRGSEPDVPINFDVHYLVQRLGDEPRIFGWVSGDEQAVLRAHGIG